MRKQIADEALAQVIAEQRYWSQSEWESPKAETLRNLLNKMQEAPVAHEAFCRYERLLKGRGTVLEVGGGQGWASCLFKRTYPESRVILTDVSADAVASRPIWERVFACTLDEAFAAAAWDVSLPDQSVDLIFAFAAAHHFVDHRAALAEHFRLLRRGGIALWLYEPTSPALLRGLAERRANNKGMQVPEHILAPKAVLAAAREVGLHAEVDFWPSVTHRGPSALLYYSVMRRIPFLSQYLPCTANFIFRRT